MIPEHIFEILADLKRAVDKLQEITQKQKTDIIRDATIQRFEFSFELFWKTCKKILAHEGSPSTSPRDTMAKAFQFHLIDDEIAFLQMLEDRNKTTHIYNEEMSDKIYENILEHATVIKKNADKLAEKYKR